MKKNNNSISCENCPSRDKGIFCDLENYALAGVSEHKVTNNYKKGHTLFFQGNPPFGLYCINTGKIKVSKIGNDGKETIVRIASAGDVLGHRSLFSGENYTATATAIEDATICFIDKEYIYESMQKEPSVAIQIIQKLSREMGAAETQSAAMFQKNVRERLAMLFIQLKNKYGINEGGRCRLDIKLTREEMASMVGTANETIIRFITEFKEEGIIEQEGKVLFIKNENKLMEFANIND